MAVVIVWHLMKSLKLESFLVNTIHDSLISEVKPEEDDTYNSLVTWATNEGVNLLYKSIRGWEFIVPLDIEIKAAKHWADSGEWQEEWII